jgi:hypothetical protein
VEWLAQRDGEAKLRHLLRALDRDQDPEVAIRGTWGASLAATRTLMVPPVGRTSTVRFSAGLFKSPRV